MPGPRDAARRPSRAAGPQGRRLRPGGLVVLDNVFLGGRVLDPAYQEERHLAMRRLNDLIAVDERVDSVMLPVRDGVTIARRR
ncbi:hypothetical protein [Streptomyces sp. NPDC002763]|uniref:O-methyltransferase n=1 Tax=Streptomyces sp. NPDC002763 TaxID=3154427 RepID=UPI00332F585C